MAVQPAVHNSAALPSTGNADKDVRLALDSGLFYQWSAANSMWSPNGAKLQAANCWPQNTDDVPDTNANNKYINTTQAGKLSQISITQPLDADALQSTVTNHIANTSNPHSTTAVQVGLGNVNNTSDANKPVSTAQATAIASAQATAISTAKSYTDSAIANLIANAPTALDTLNELALALGNDSNFSATMTTALGNRLRVDTSAQGLNATQQLNGVTNLGLQNVNNTSDLNKPVSTAQAAAIALASHTLTADDISDIADATISSSTDALLGTMTVTLPAGSYMFWFSASVTTTIVGGAISFSYYLGGTQVPQSLRKLIPLDGGTLSFGSARGGIYLVKKITVNGSQAVEVRASISSGTATAGIRTLAWLQVG